MKKLTLQAIAQAANVSCATVSRCLSGREGVGEKTRERVLQLCREMGYNPNFMETAPHRSGRIGMICPSLMDPGSARLAAELEVHLSELGYGLLLAQSHGTRQGEQEALARMAAQHVDGLIMIPVSRESRKLLRSMENAPETVFLGAYLGDQPESYVAVDHFLGGQAAVRYLHSLGCGKILFIGREDSEINNKRRGGVVSALRQLHLQGTCVDVKQLEQYNWNDWDAVIAGEYTIALQVPEEKRLVSFDGDMFPDVGITTFDSPSNMAGIAADILLEKLDRPIGGYSHRMVVPQLRLRKMEGKHNG